MHFKLTRHFIWVIPPNILTGYFQNLIKEDDKFTIQEAYSLSWYNVVSCMNNYIEMTALIKQLDRLIQIYNLSLVLLFLYYTRLTCNKFQYVE